MAHQYQSSTKNAVRLHNGLFAGFILLSVLTITDGMYISQMFERKQKNDQTKSMLGSSMEIEVFF